MRWGRKATDQAKSLMAGLPKEGDVTPLEMVVFRHEREITMKYFRKFALRAVVTFWACALVTVLIVTGVVLALRADPAALP